MWFLGYESIQQCLRFLPLPQGQGALCEIFGSKRMISPAGMNVMNIIIGEMLICSGSHACGIKFDSLNVLF